MSDTIRQGDPAYDVKDASDLIALLTSGKTLAEAAESMGQPVEGLLTKKAVQKRLEELQNVLPFVNNPDAGRKLLLARAFETLLTGDDKDAAAAARTIAMAPEFGLRPKEVGNQGPVVNINLSEDVSKMEPGIEWGETNEKA